MKNIDSKTVASFGEEWKRHSQAELDAREHEELFSKYFSIFPWDQLPDQASGFDMGCGSGRWAALVAPRVGHLHCIDPAEQALAVCQSNLAVSKNVTFHHASVDAVDLEESRQDFGYSLGVLHHIPDTRAALRSCVALLKPGAPFLLYLYYAFDNKPQWYRGVWRASELLRAGISRMPESPKSIATDALAAMAYLPAARLAALAEKFGTDVSNWPLNDYRKLSFYTMRTDSRDRFGTPLEQRFTRSEITQLMGDAGLANIQFSENTPFWCAVGYKV